MIRSCEYHYSVRITDLTTLDEASICSRVKGMGDDRLTNPRYYSFRKMWHKLYYFFTP